MSWPKGQSNTARAKYSDQQLIDAWRVHQGKTEEIARYLGVNTRSMLERRREVERRHNIKLNSFQSGIAVAISENRTVVNAEIEDGYGIVFGDAHFYRDQRSTIFRALLLLIHELKPSFIVNNGDSFDGAAISRHASIGWEDRQSVKEELDANEARLEEIAQAYPAARFFWPLGNHDLRYETHLAAHAPEYRGVKGVHLKDFYPRWTPCWRVDVNAGDPQGYTVIRHRENGGANAGRANAQKMGCHSVTGHDHVGEVVYHANYAGRFYACRHGMTADAAGDPQFVNYLEAREPSWLSSFAVLRYKNGALLRPQLCEKVSDGVVQWGCETFEV